MPVTPTIDGILAAAGELQALPDSWQHLDAVLARSAATTAHIAEAIAQDPGLSMRLLRLANSPMFGLSQRIERLSQAVHLIGTRQLRELALAVSVVDLVGRSGRRDRVASYLRHSTSVGLCARAIASRRREANIERFFVAGLLHDIGRFVLELAEPDLVADQQTQARQRAVPIETIETASLGFDHAAIGGALLRRWNLPSTLCEPVAWHHLPSSAPSQRVETATVHLASVAAELLGLDDGEAVSTPLDQSAYDLVGLDAADLIGAVSEAASALAETLTVLVGTAA